MQISRTTIIGAASILVTLACFILFALGNLTLEQATGAAVAFIGILVGIGFKLSQDQNTHMVIAIFLLTSIALSQTACGPDTLRKRVAASIDSSGNAVDLAFGITQDLYDYKKISAEEARRYTIALRKTNASVEAAGKRALNWISEVEAAERLAKERGEKFEEPKAIPKEVREDIERLLDEAVKALRDIGNVTEKRLFKQISRILEMINRFRRLLSG